MLPREDERNRLGAGDGRGEKERLRRTNACEEALVDDALVAAAVLRGAIVLLHEAEEEEKARAAAFILFGKERRKAFEGSLLLIARKDIEKK